MIPPTARITYNYCQICGRQPKTNLDEPNHSPLRWWDPDDGWIIGALCRWCWEEFGPTQPDPEDFAYRTTNQVCDDERTEQDSILVFFEKIAWIRDPGKPVGKPGVGRLNCPCGNAPQSKFEPGPDVKCNCGRVYTWDGRIKR